MSVEVQRVPRCCGVGPPLRGLLIHAYLKLIANGLIVAVFFYLAQTIPTYAPNEPPYPLILLLTISIMTLDSSLLIAIIIRVHLHKKTPLMELYYRYGLMYMGIIVIHGTIWLLYLMTRTRPGESPESVFVITGMTTVFCMLFHAYFVMLLHFIVLDVTPGSQLDLRTASPDLTDGNKNKIKEIHASAFDYV